jgi:hypothetical protein
MSDENQGRSGPGHEPPPPGGREPEHPAFAYLEPGGSRDPRDAPPTFEPRGQSPPGLVAWLLILAALGAGALVTGQSEAALFIGLAGLFAAAQGADTDPRWNWIHAAVAWVPAVTGFLFLSGLTVALFESEFTPQTRLAVTAAAALSALLCLASQFRPVADRLSGLLFRGDPPSHSLRLTTRLVLLALLLALPTWFAVRGELSPVLEQPELLITPRSLSGSLVGYIVLAFASVGYLVRRSLRQVMARLGITPLRLTEIATVGAGVAALWLFNAGSEWFQRGAFPELWASDQEFTESLARIMSPAQMVLLGLSAGIGEEITLRGALQPRLGIVLTSLLFAALHVQYSWYGIASLFVFGVILGLIRKWGGTTAAIAVHAVYNTLALMLART